MSQSLQRIVMKDVHGWLNYDVTFQDGINVLYGRNGTGKTTLLHVIANLLGGDVTRFLFLKFAEIRATFANGQNVVLQQSTDSNIPRLREIVCSLNGEVLGTVNRASERNAEVHGEVSPHRMIGEKLRDAIKLEPTYFPAFRSILEARPQAGRTLEARYSDMSTIERYLAESRTFSARLPGAIARTSDPNLDLARELFGPFVPQFTYPAPMDVQRGIDSEVSDALLKVAAANRKLFSRTFVSTLDAVIEAVSPESSSVPDQPGVILSDIKSLLQELKDPTDEVGQTYQDLLERVESLKPDMPSELSNSIVHILLTYKQALESRLDEERHAFAALETFRGSVNDFLEGKELVITRLPDPEKAPRLGARRKRHFAVQLNGSTADLSVLSSGERQLVCMIYAATHIAANSSTTDAAVLIDEPELSLHIAWQRKLLTEMMNQIGNKQIIVCTHSPDIGGNHLRAVQELDYRLSTEANHQPIGDESEGSDLSEEGEVEDQPDTDFNLPV